MICGVEKLLVILWSKGKGCKKGEAKEERGWGKEELSVTERCCETTSRESPSLLSEGWQGGEG